MKKTKKRSRNYILEGIWSNKGKDYTGKVQINDYKLSEPINFEIGSVQVKPFLDHMNKNYRPFLQLCKENLIDNDTQIYFSKNHTVDNQYKKCLYILHKQYYSCVQGCEYFKGKGKYLHFSKSGERKYILTGKWINQREKAKFCWFTGTVNI